MTNFGWNWIFPFIIALCLFSTSSAEVFFQEGGCISIKEGKILTINCLSNTTANINFLFNSSVVGRCVYSLGKCNENDIFNVTANIGVQPYQYGLVSKTGVDTSLAGTYICRDGTNAFESSINVSVTDVDIKTYYFVEDENTVSLTFACILDMKIYDINVEWFIFDNKTLTKMNLSLVTDIVEPFTTKKNCTPCGSSVAQNISTGLILKPTNETLTYVYLEIKFSHTNFTTKNRTRRAYPFKVTADNSYRSNKDPIGLIVGVSASLGFVGFVVVIILIVIMRKSVVKCLRNCRSDIRSYCRYVFCKRIQDTKQITNICWRTLEDDGQECIAGCKSHTCEIDKVFLKHWSERWEHYHCKRWNEASMKHRKELFVIDDTYIELHWKHNEKRSEALNIFFNNATEEDKNAIFNKVFKDRKDKQTAFVMNNWPKLDASQQNEFWTSLGKCTKIMSLLWRHLECRVKVKLCLHFWTFLTPNVQKMCCEIILTSKNAYLDIQSRIASVVKSTITIPNEEKDEKNEEVKQLLCVLSEYGPDQHLKLFKDFDKINDFKADNYTFDEMFEQLTEDLKLKMMGKTDQSRRVFVTSGFWRKLREHKTEIPFDEVCCLGRFISSRTKNNSTINWLEQMNWRKINEVLDSLDLVNIFLHVEWTNIHEDIRQQWMDEQWKRDSKPCINNRHLCAMSARIKTSQGNKIACIGEETDTGFTGIHLWFDESTSRTEVHSIAVTITSTTSEPLCENLNNVLVDMLGKFDLGLYLRRMPEFEELGDNAKGSADKSKRSTDTSKGLSDKAGGAVDEGKGSADKAEGSTVKAEGSIVKAEESTVKSEGSDEIREGLADKAKEDIINVLGNNINVDFHESNGEETLVVT